MKQEQETELYKGFEIFSDPCYYDMIAVRKQGNKTFKDVYHVDTVQQAKEYIDKQIKPTP